MEAELKIEDPLEKFVSIEIVRTINIEELFLWSKSYFSEHCPEAVHSKIESRYDAGDGDDLGTNWKGWRIRSPNGRFIDFDVFPKHFKLSVTNHPDRSRCVSFADRRWYIRFNKKYGSIITKFSCSFGPSSLSEFFKDEDLKIVIDYLKRQDV